MCVLHCSISVHTGMDVHLRVRVKWKLKKMRAAVGICLWERFDHSSTHPLPSLTINISLSSHLLLLLPPFSSSTHHPSLSLFFYGWVVIFPWDSGGGELSRECCFIVPNKSREHVQTTSPLVQRWNPQTETASFFFFSFFSYAVPVNTVPLFLASFSTSILHLCLFIFCFWFIPRVSFTICHCIRFTAQTKYMGLNINISQ